MNAREAKAIELADRGRVVRNGDRWIVFSLNGPDRYEVTLEPLSCTCADFETTHVACKHAMAARIALSREGCDFRTEPNSEQEPVKWPRKTYSQDWPAYEAAQTREKDEFLALLHDLCSRIETPQRQGRGRPPVPLSDAVYSVCLKVFTGLSVRRFMSDLREAHRRGYLSHLPHHNTVSRTLESEEVAPILNAMLVQSALPLRAIEDEFAVDSTGFSASKFDRWYDHKYGRNRSEQVWVKAHVMTGTTTHVVVSAIILDGDTSDSPQFPKLVSGAANNFTIGQVTADSAYAAEDNFQTVAAAGGTGYIAFRKTATGAIGGLFERSFHLFSLNKEEYLQRYHRRSNIESTFSSVKRKFGDSVRSKTPIAMRNEVMAKLICHNISQLIHLSYELGIDLNFGNDPKTNNEPHILSFRRPG